MTTTSTEEFPTEEQAWTAVAVDVLQVVADVLDRLEPETQDQITDAITIEASDYIDCHNLIGRVQTAMDAINYNN